MSLSFIITSAFEIEQKLSNFVFSNTKTNSVTYLNPLNSDNIFFSLFLITDSISLSSSSELKEFKTSPL